MRVRRVVGLGAVVLSAATMLVSTPSADACSSVACTTALPDRVRRDPGDGVLCAYVKLDDPPPEGHEFGPGGAPYIWVDTQSWGARHPDQWDYQVCPPQ